MTDKERLEHIKNKTRNLCYEADEYGNAEANVQAIYNDMVWLIQQAERVEELEEEIENWRKVKEATVKLLGENKRYKQALEFYADEEHYKEKLINEAQYDADGICISNDEYAPPIIYFDSGEKARQALKGDEN